MNLYEIIYEGILEEVSESVDDIDYFMDTSAGDVTRRNVERFIDKFLLGLEYRTKETLRDAKKWESEDGE